MSTGFIVALGNDFIVKSHLADLYDTLLEGNLLKIIEPFSVVEIVHISELIDLPMRAVETK
jgi:26S proteasome regulatory subunit N6